MLVVLNNLKSNKDNFNIKSRNCNSKEEVSLRNFKFLLSFFCSFSCKFCYFFLVFFKFAISLYLLQKKIKLLTLNKQAFFNFASKFPINFFLNNFLILFSKVLT